MAITAKGSWESVKRHFAEMGKDCQNEDFTCVGVGSMAGDVYGNAMLLSKHILKKSMMYKLLLQTGLLPGAFF